QRPRAAGAGGDVDVLVLAPPRLGDARQHRHHAHPDPPREGPSCLPRAEAPGAHQAAAELTPEPVPGHALGMPGPAPASADLYLDLLAGCLTRELFLDEEV